MKKLIVALSLMVGALSFVSIKSAVADQYVTDFAQDCTLAKGLAGQNHFAFKGDVVVSLQTWDGDPSGKKNFSYNNHGDGTYLVVNFNANYRISGAQIIGEGKNTNQNGDFLYFNTRCVSIPSTKTAVEVVGKVKPDETGFSGHVYDCYGSHYVVITAKVRGHANMTFYSPPDNKPVFSNDGYQIFPYSANKSRHGSDTIWSVGIDGGPYADIRWANAECVIEARK